MDRGTIMKKFSNSGEEWDDDTPFPKINMDKVNNMYYSLRPDSALSPTSMNLVSTDEQRQIEEMLNMSITSDKMNMM
jgi:hypothetical protein